MYMERRGYLSVQWSWAMLAMLKDMIKENQSCKSNEPLHMKQDTLHQYSYHSIPLNINLR